MTVIFSSFVGSKEERALVLVLAKAKNDSFDEGEISQQY